MGGGRSSKTHEPKDRPQITRGYSRCSQISHRMTAFYDSIQKSREVRLLSNLKNPRVAKVSGGRLAKGSIRKYSGTQQSVSVGQ